MALARDRLLRAEHGLVVAQHPQAAEAGIAAFEAGGNAVDAAVAAVFGATVADVGRTGIGGYGGHLLYYEAASGKTWVVDFLSRAPAAAHEGMFDPAQPQGSGKVQQTGPLAVGVPAVVVGLAEAHGRFGTLPWAEVLAPAIRLAEDGIHFPAEGRDQVIAEVPRIGRFAETMRVFVAAWDGEELRQPDLAGTLRVLAREGAPAMYRGDVGAAIVRYLRSEGGLLDHTDLAGCEATIGLATASRYRGLDVRTPGASSGGGVLVPLLGALDHFDLPSMEPLGRERMALLAAATGRIWPDRLALSGALISGDAGEMLLTPEYAGRVAADIRAGSGAFSERPDASGCTDHLVVADAAGNVVAVTTTNQMLMGSGVTVPGTGIVLNNAMGLFDPLPGRPNSVASRKRVVSNMSPTIVLDEGRPRLATGASGGRRIPSMVTQVLTLMVDHGWTGDRALAAPRYHHEGNGTLIVEEGLSDATLEGLRAIGYTVDVRLWSSMDLGGQTPTLWFDRDGHPYGAPDPRRHGGAAAW